MRARRQWMGNRRPRLRPIPRYRFDAAGRRRHGEEDIREEVSANFVNGISVRIFVNKNNIVNIEKTETEIPKTTLPGSN